MAQHTEDPQVHHGDAIDHLEEEIMDLEHVNPVGRAVRWIGGTIIVVAVIAWVVWLVASPPSSTSVSRSYTPSNIAGVDLSQPRGVLDAAPAHFAWDTVTGRLQYVVRIFIQGEGNPVLEKIVTTAYLDLSPDEQARLPRGKTYVWTVTVQAKDGSNMAAGQATFKVR